MIYRFFYLLKLPRVHFLSCVYPPHNLSKQNLACRLLHFIMAMPTTLGASLRWISQIITYSYLFILSKKKQVCGVGGLASLAKKDWMNTRLRLTLTNHVVCV